MPWGCQEHSTFPVWTSTLAQMAGTASVHVQAPAPEVFTALSDVTRMAEWSPECYRCEWLDGASVPAVGARFRGYNRRGWMRWRTTCRVTYLEDNHVFAFEVVQPIFGVQTRWRYELGPVEAGTRLTESFEVLWLFPGVVHLLFGGKKTRQAELEENVRQSLQQIKATIEVD